MWSLLRQSVLLATFLNIPYCKFQGSRSPMSSPRWPPLAPLWPPGPPPHPRPDSQQRCAVQSQVLTRLTHHRTTALEGDEENQRLTCCPGRGEKSPAGRTFPGTACPPPHHHSMACCLHCTALHESFCLPCWVVVTQLALHNNCGVMCVIIRLAGNGFGVRRQNKFLGMRAWADQRF